MENNVNTIELHIQLPDDNSCDQHYHEIGLFLSRKEDDFIQNHKECFGYMGLNFEMISDYDVFIFLWLMFKTLNNYTESVAFNINIWDNKITFIDNKIAFVDGNGNVILDENAYHCIANAIRERYKGLI